MEKKTPSSWVVGWAALQQRLGDLHRSFAEALVKVKGLRDEIETGELKRLDHSALRRFLDRADRGF